MAKQKTHNHKCTDLLSEISTLFKRESTRSTGFFLMNQIETSQLNPSEYVQYCFLQGKHLTIQYRNSQNKNPAILNQANLWFDELVQYAVDNGIKIQQEYFYLRIKTKWLIASHNSDDSKKFRMVSRLRVICKHALSCFPKSTAIQSLYNTIQS